MSFDFWQIPFLPSIGTDPKGIKQLSAIPQGIGNNSFAFARSEAALGGMAFYQLLLSGEQKLNLENKESNNAGLLSFWEKDGERAYNKGLGKISTIDIIEAALKNQYPMGLEEPGWPSFAKGALCKGGGSEHGLDRVIGMSGDAEIVSPLRADNGSRVVGIPLYANEKDASLFYSSELRLSDNSESSGKDIKLEQEASNDIIISEDKVLNGVLISDTQINSKKNQNEEKACGGANNYLVSSRGPVSGENAIDVNDKESYGTLEANLFEKLQFLKNGTRTDKEESRAPEELRDEGIDALLPKNTAPSPGQIVWEHEGYVGNIKYEGESKEILSERLPGLKFEKTDNVADLPQGKGRYSSVFAKDVSVASMGSSKPYKSSSKEIQVDMAYKVSDIDLHNLPNNEDQPDEAGLFFGRQEQGFGGSFSSSWVDPESGIASKSEQGNREYSGVFSKDVSVASMVSSKPYDPISKGMQAEMLHKMADSDFRNLPNDEDRPYQTWLTFDGQEQDFGRSFGSPGDFEFEVAFKSQRDINTKQLDSDKPRQSALRQEEGINELQSSDLLEILTQSQAEEKEVFHVASDVKRLMETVAKTIDLNKGASSVIKVTIYPEELGEVEVRVGGEKERLIVKLFAVEPETKDLMETELGELKDRLLTVGYEVQEISVEGGEGDGSSHRQDLPKGWARSARGYREAEDSEFVVSQVTSSLSNISLFA